MYVSRLSVLSLLLNFFSISTNTAWALQSNEPYDPQFFDYLCDGSGGDRPRCKENHVLVDVPGSCVENNASVCPIVFFFHGAGGSNIWFPKLSGVHSHGYIGVYPQGEDGWNTGPKSTNNCDYTDYDCQEDPNEALFIYNIIGGLRAEGASGNVYLIGNSNGAALTYRVAVNAHPSNGIKAIIAKVTQLLAEPEQSGPGPENYNTIQPGFTPRLSVLNIMGSADNVIPYAGGSSPVFGDHEEFQLMDALESVRAWADHNGCDTDAIETALVTDTGDNTATKYEFQNCQEGTQVVHYNLHGAGHDAGGATIEDVKVDFDLIYNFIQSVENETSPPPPPAPTPPAPTPPTPTPPSGGDCEDDPTWYGKFSNSHDCNYVSENLKRCAWENAQGVTATVACRLTCDPDSCETETEPTATPPEPSPSPDCVDDPEWAGKFNSDHDCDYVAESPHSRCEWKNSKDERAFEKCPQACSSC